MEVLLQIAISSRIDAEQLVEELHFSGNTGLEKDALEFAHHAHDFDSLECGVSRFRRFKAEHGSNSAFDGTLIGFDLVVQIFHLSMIDRV